jgi:hypothetical protein
MNRIWNPIQGSIQILTIRQQCNAIRFCPSIGDLLALFEASIRAFIHASIHASVQSFGVNHRSALHTYAFPLYIYASAAAALRAALSIGRKTPSKGPKTR